MLGNNILTSCKAQIRFLKDNNFIANDRGSLEIMVKYSTHQKTKYVDEFHLPNPVCTGFDPVISSRENCHKHVQHMCRGEERTGRQQRECVCVRGKEGKLFPQPRLHEHGL